MLFLVKNTPAAVVVGSGISDRVTITTEAMELFDIVESIVEVVFDHNAWLEEVATQVFDWSSLGATLVIADFEAEDVTHNLDASTAVFELEKTTNDELWRMVRVLITVTVLC